MSDADPHDELVHGLARPSFVRELESDLALESITLAPTIGVTARRVGVVADTHCASADGSDIPGTLLRALEGCDLILHCGDITHFGTLDRLATVAPVIAVRSAADPAPDGLRLHDGPILVRAGRTLIGMAADLPALIEPSELFGTDVDIALSGTSHVPHVARVGATLVVNPGSPTIPLSSAGPTAATIILDGAQSAATIIHLPGGQP